MPVKKQIIKDGQVVNDDWLLLDASAQAEAATVPAGKVIVSLDVWQSQPAIHNRSDIGVLLPNDVDLHSIAEDLGQLPLIAINFPAYRDGRGFSLARLLRERYAYKGEIRAVGRMIRDQLCYLKRCGFNAFSFSDDVNLNAALASLHDFTEAYQAAVDQPEPLFRHRVQG